MADIRDTLRQLAIEIRDEHNMGANTAKRVGSLLLALVDAGIDVEGLKKLFLSRQKDDEASGLITFLKGIISDTITSQDFSSGSLGSGFIIKRDPLTGRSYLEVDDLSVRMKAVFKELIIESLHHVGGEMVLSPARMKCFKVEELSDTYRCYFDRGEANEAGCYEVEQEFTIGAQARCQVFTGNRQKFYWRLVTRLGADYIDLSKTDCYIGSDIPEANDDIVQLGHRTDEDGTHAIILSAYGPDSPSCKQYTCIDSYSLVDKEVSVTSPKGNKYVGDFMLKTGVNIATQLQILENLIKTEIQSVEYILNGDDNYLKNASFVKDMEGWQRESDVRVLSAEEPLKVNSEYLTMADKVADVITYEGKLWLRLKNSHVKQVNSNLTKPEKAGRFYVSLRYICTGTGTLTCGFPDSTLYKTMNMAISRNTRIIEFSGEWDGSGDFLIQFTGDIYINLVTLTNRPLDDFKKETTSQFEQTNDSIKAVVKSIDNINKTIKDSGWLTTSDGTKIWASCTFPDGTKAVSLFNVTADGIFLDSSRINLKGIVTFDSFSDDFKTAYNRAFGNASMTAKDDLAKQLGYNNYLELAENAATKGKAILVGGYLNLDLIDVDTLLANKIISNKIVTSLNGKRIEIDPETNSIKLYNDFDHEILAIEFIDEIWGGETLSMPRIRMRNRISSGEDVSLADIHPSSLHMMFKGGDNIYDMTLGPSTGLRFLKNNELTNYIPISK